MNSQMAIESLADAVKIESVQVVQSVNWNALRDTLTWLVEQNTVRAMKDASERAALQKRIVELETKMADAASAAELDKVAGRVGKLETKTSQMDERQDGLNEILEVHSKELVKIEETIVVNETASQSRDNDATQERQQMKEETEHVNQRCADLSEKMDVQNTSLRTQLQNQATGRIAPLEKKVQEIGAHNTSETEKLKALDAYVKVPPEGSHAHGVNARLAQLEELRKLNTPDPTVAGVKPTDTSKDAADHGEDRNNAGLTKRVADCEWLIDALQVGWRALCGERCGERVVARVRWRERAVARVRWRSRACGGSEC